ncbi:thioesterase II family protein [Streptomyces sp. YIM S03343]
MRSDDQTRWLRRFRPAANVKARLICFPPAGSAASFYRAWPDAVPSEIDVMAVQYPGRQERLGEDCERSMEGLAAAITMSLLPLADRPLAFFGHSMGASVAFEVAARLEATHEIAGIPLFLAARKAPHRVRRLDIDCDDDQALLKELEVLGSPDTQVLADPELRELALPAIRADFKICQTYRRSEQPNPLDTTAVFYRGSGDPGTDADDVRDWSDVIRNGVQESVLPGGHFFVIRHERILIQDVTRRIYRSLSN